MKKKRITSNEANEKLIDLAYQIGRAIYPLAEPKKWKKTGLEYLNNMIELELGDD